MKNLSTLSLSKSKELKGKKITSFYSGYSGQDGIINFIVGEVISSYELAKRTPLEGWNNQAEMWDAQMSVERLKDVKRTLEILREDGTPTWIRSHYSYVLKQNDDFTCSDIDRYVSYKIID